MKKEKPTVKQQAIRCLSRREYGRAELAQRLIRDGAARDEVDAALDELTQLGLLSDERFAEALVRRRQGKYSKRSIAMQLKEQGIDAETAEAALTTLDETSEEDEVLALWQQRFGKLPDDGKEKNKQIRFLMSRGYSAAAVLKMFRNQKSDDR